MNTEIERQIRPWRQRIDEVDDRLVDLLNQRAGYAQRIGEIKRAASVPIYEPRRETEILDRVVQHNQGPLPGAAVRRLFERIIDESRSHERSAGGAGSPASSTNKS